MLTKLALQNIRQKKYRNLLAGLSLTIATGSLILFLGLSSGIQQATFEELEKSNPLTEITVRPNTDDTGVIAFLAQSEENKLSQKTVEQISEIPHVKAVYPETQFNNYASVQAQLLGFSLITDTMAFGVPKEYIEKDLEDPSIWETTEEPYPAIIPKKLLDIYNFTIASPQGLPLLSEENLHGTELTFLPNYSTFFPGMNKRGAELKFEVVGFSNRVNLVGMTMPDHIVDKLNKDHTESPESQYLEIFVEAEEAADTPEIAAKIEELGYSTQYLQKNIEEVEAKFNYLSITIGIISFIILITATIAIVNTFLATVAERTKEIGLFRALGATKKQIKHIILIEAGVIGIFGSIIGIIIGTLSSKAIDTFGLEKLATTTFVPKSLFNIDLTLTTGILIFGTLLAVLTAYIPANKAANVDPIKALNK